MRYFLPYWEDWVHKDFDPLNEDTGKKGFSSAIFAHEIFKEPPYDGILVSLGLFKFKLRLIKTNGRPRIREFSNIRDYLRLPRNIKIMGDCGAFTYVNNKIPSIDVEEAVNNYESLGFDYGISVDHICIDNIVVNKRQINDFAYVRIKKIYNNDKVMIELSNEEKEFRRLLSIENAYKFLQISKNKKFIPIGAVQGYSIETYIDSLKQIIDQGYEYIAIGGLVTRSTKFISHLLDRIYEEVDTKQIKIHLLGILREELLQKMKNYNIYSFDSASYYRKSWLRIAQNYLGNDGNWYASIRIPYSKFLKSRSSNINYSLDRLQKMEEKILKSLRDYDKGSIKSIDYLVEDIIEYDKILFRESFDENKFLILYKQVLQSKIWKECNCSMCKSLGIDIIIFRGSNRNKRRGFHNTYIFYHKVLNFLR